MKQKTLRGDRTAAERKIAALQPAAGGESCKQDSFLYYVKNWLAIDARQVYTDKRQINTGELVEAGWEEVINFDPYTWCG